jgi:hypothetical protein
MSASQVAGWTFYFLTPTGWAAETKTARPFETIQLQGTPSVGTIVTQFNRFWHAVQEATRGGRSLPFGPVGAVYKDVSFTSGSAIGLPHNLGTSRVRALGWPTAGSMVPGVQSLSADGSLVVLTPSATFTADVIFTVYP